MSRRGGPVLLATRDDYVRRLALCHNEGFVDKRQNAVVYGCVYLPRRLDMNEMAIVLAEDYDMTEMLTYNIRDAELHT